MDNEKITDIKDIEYKKEIAKELLTTNRWMFEDKYLNNEHVSKFVDIEFSTDIVIVKYILVFEQDKIKSITINRNDFNELIKLIIEHQGYGK